VKKYHPLGKVMLAEILNRGNNYLWLQSIRPGLPGKNHRSVSGKPDGPKRAGNAVRPGLNPGNNRQPGWGENRGERANYLFSHEIAPLYQGVEKRLLSLMRSRFYSPLFKRGVSGDFITA
jgi:hypothetical protein